MAETLLNQFLRPELKKVADRVVINLKNSLRSRNLIDKERLINSVRAEVVIKSTSDFEIRLFWRDYGNSLNFGADVGYLSKAGQTRLERWVVEKLRQPQYKTTEKTGKRYNNARRIAKAIQTKWAKTGKFPSSISRGRGWASVALRSRGAADLQKLTSTALGVAFRKFTESKVRDANKRNPKKGRR